MRIIKHMMLMLAVLVLATGCIKEDYDDCDNVTIYFQYLADGDTDVLYKYMHKVDLYVFDEGGHILGVGHYNQDELSNFAAKPSFRLPKDRRYKVVAVGNADENTEVVNVNATSFNDIYIKNPSWQDGSGETLTSTHDDNYMGEKEFTMPSGDGVMYRDTVTLYSSHIDVDIKIYGLPAPPESTRQAENIPYVLTIENSNGATDFHNHIMDEATGTCYPELYYNKQGGYYHTHDFALFRMDTNGELDADCCQHVLKLSDKEGNVLIEGALYDVISSNSNLEELVTRQEAQLPLNIRFDKVKPVIEIPEWVIAGGDQPDWN